MTSKNQLIENILDKWPVKVICFVVAIFLYIFHQSIIIDKKTFVIPLHFSENGCVMHIGEVPSSIPVVIKASPDEISLIHNSDIYASVNLDMITQPGNYKLPINLKFSDSILSFDPLEVRLKQEYLNIQVDTKSQKFVQVLPSLVGEVSHGYTISNVSVDPSYVLISGPQTLIARTQQIVTNKVNVSNAMTNFTVETNYVPISNLINIDQNQECKVTISVVPQAMNKTLQNIPISVINLSENLTIQETLPTVSMTITGDVTVVEKFTESKAIVQIDLSDIEEIGEYEVSIHYNTPNNIAVLEKSMEYLTINIIEKPQDLETEEEEQKDSL